jgi:hypothetical protein
LLLLAVNAVLTFNTYRAGELGEAAAAATFMFIVNALLAGTAIECFEETRGRPPC